MNFASQKALRLEHVDLSRKGSVDEALLDVVNLINSFSQYFTTSSCSGRIIVFENDEHMAEKIQKKGCKWLHVSHSPVYVGEIKGSLKAASGEAVFKFEPMVMHIQCETLEDARKMHQAAVSAGFRNSGITVGTKGKIMMAVRSTHSLEVPLSAEGEVLVSHQYLVYLTSAANRKMEENFSRIKRFHENVQLITNDSSSVVESKKRNKGEKVKGHSSVSDGMPSQTNGKVKCDSSVSDGTPSQTSGKVKGDSSVSDGRSGMTSGDCAEDGQWSDSDGQMDLFMFDDT